MNKYSHNSDLDINHSSRSTKTKIFDNIPQGKHLHLQNSSRLFNLKPMQLQDQSTRQDTNISQAKGQLCFIPQTRSFFQESSHLKLTDQTVYQLGESIKEASFRTPCKVGLFNDRQNIMQELMKVSKESEYQRSILQSQEYDKSVVYESSDNDNSQDHFKTIQENIQEEQIYSSNKKQIRRKLDFKDDENLQDCESSVNQINNFSLSGLRNYIQSPLSSIDNSYQLVSPTIKINGKQQSYVVQQNQQLNHPNPVGQNISQNQNSNQDSGYTEQASQENLPQSDQSIGHQMLDRALNQDTTQTNIQKETLIQFLNNVHHLCSGMLFKKFGRNDHYFPSKRFIQLSPDLKHLILMNESNQIKKVYPTNQVTQIQIGRKTENFKRFKSEYEQNNRSCSLMMKERTLDLESIDFVDLDQFVTSLSYVLKVINKAFTGLVLLDDN